MTDRIEALERLDELRRTGALSDAEFEAEKARLMADDATPAAPPVSVEVEPVAPARRFPVLAIVLAVIALVLGVSYYVYRLIGGPPPVEVAQAPTRPPPGPPPPALPRPDDLRALPAGEQLSRAALAAFGNADGATIEVESGQDYGEGSTSVAERVEYQPKQLVWATFGPVLVSQGTVPDAAHVSAGKVAAHYLRVDGDRFTLLQAYPKAVVAGSSGSVASVAVRSDMGPDPVIVTEGGGTWQGYTCSGATLTALRPTGPVEIGFVPLGFDNSGGAGEIASIAGRIANVVPGRSFDAVYSGTRAFTETYVLTGGKYVLQGGGKSQLETC